MSSRKLCVMAAAGGLALGFAASAYGDPITYQTQSRSVSATSMATGFARGGTSPSSTTLQQNQSQQANDFGAFDGNVTATSTFGPASPMATSSAVQQSSLNATGFSVSGSVGANSDLGAELGPVGAAASTAFNITFDVTQAEPYSFDMNLKGAVDPAAPGNTSARLSLTNAQGGNVFAPITTVNLSDAQFQGTLAAGVYSLAMTAQAASNDQSTNSVDYAFSLAAGSSALLGADVNLDANIVPLPSAASAALAMMACLAAGGFVRRRYRDWVRLAMV